MQDNEYQVVLDAKIDKFKQKMQEAQNVATKTSKIIGSKAQAQLAVDILGKQINQIKNKMAELEKVAFKFNETINGELISREPIGTKEQIEEYNKLQEKLDDLLEKQGVITEALYGQNSVLAQQNKEYAEQIKMLEQISNLKVSKPAISGLGSKFSLAEGNQYSGQVVSLDKVGESADRASEKVRKLGNET